MIVAENLIKAYGNSRVVDDVSFHVGEGEVVAIIGPNGAGKSTTLKMICGLIKPTSGTVSVDKQTQ
jgi:ABC-2 type transport system ATP-binding protein